MFCFHFCGPPVCSVRFILAMFSMNNFYINHLAINSIKGYDFSIWSFKYNIYTANFSKENCLLISVAICQPIFNGFGQWPSQVNALYTDWPATIRPCTSTHKNQPTWEMYSPGGHTILEWPIFLNIYIWFTSNLKGNKVLLGFCISLDTVNGLICWKDE